MPAEVENMFYVRQKPWHGIGISVENSLTSFEAIKKAGLDWTVEKEPIMRKGKDTGSFFTVRKSSDPLLDDALLGIGLSGRYEIIQNSEAFEFVDSLISDEKIKYETAGSLLGGKKIWLLAKMPKREINGEEIEPYICFTNSHDGSGAVRCCMTPIRVVCNNTLTLALRSAKRSWSTRHTGDIKQKISSAKETLGLAEKYMDEFENDAQVLLDIKLTDGDIEDIFNTVYPITDDTTERSKKSIEGIKANFDKCLAMPDIISFKNTGYGVINAVADLNDHYDPVRKTQQFESNRWNNIIQGNTILNDFYSVISNNF